MGKRPSPTGSAGRRPNLRQLGGAPAATLGGIVGTPHGSYKVKMSHGTRRSGELKDKKAEAMRAKQAKSSSRQPASRSTRYW